MPPPRSPSDRTGSGHRGEEEGGLRAEPAAERRGRSAADQRREDARQSRGSKAGDVLARPVKGSASDRVLRRDSESKRGPGILAFEPWLPGPLFNALRGSLKRDGSAPRRRIAVSHIACGSTSKSRSTSTTADEPGRLRQLGVELAWSPSRVAGKYAGARRRVIRSARGAAASGDVDRYTPSQIVRYSGSAGASASRIQPRSGSTGPPMQSGRPFEPTTAGSSLTIAAGRHFGRPIERPVRRRRPDRSRTATRPRGRNSGPASAASTPGVAGLERVLHDVSPRSFVGRPVDVLGDQRILTGRLRSCDSSAAAASASPLLPIATARFRRSRLTPARFIALPFSACLQLVVRPRHRSTSRGASSAARGSHARRSDTPVSTA